MTANQRRKHEAKRKKCREAMLALEQAQVQEMEKEGKVDWLRAVGFDQVYSSRKEAWDWKNTNNKLVEKTG